MRPSEADNEVGPSLARSKRRFVEAFGTERMLLFRTNVLLKIQEKLRSVPLYPAPYAAEIHRRICEMPEDELLPDLHDALMRIAAEVEGEHHG